MKITKLNNFLSELDKTYNINNGGCCYIAYVLANLLEQHNIPYSFVIEDECEYISGDLVAECIENRSCEECCYGLFDETCIHYMISVNNKLLNKMEETKISNCHFFDGVDSSDILWIYETGSWNPAFDKSYKDEIFEKLSKFFDENF